MGRTGLPQAMYLNGADMALGCMEKDWVGFCTVVLACCVLEIE